MIEILSLKILIIEDNPDDAEMIKTFLADSHFNEKKFFVASKLKDAIESKIFFLPDLILLDLALPDSFGLSTYINCQLAFPAVPIVILTGNQDLEIIHAAMEKGAQDHISKDLLSPISLFKAITYAYKRNKIMVNTSKLNRSLEKIVKEKNEDLNAAQDHYRLLVENFPDGAVYLLNENYEPVIKGSDLLKDGFCKCLKLNSPECLLNNDLQLIRKRLESVIHETDTNFSEEVCCIERRTFLLQNIPLTNSNVDVYSRMIILTDITERKIVENEIYGALMKEKELNKLKSRFVSMISHEFRTPLTMILSSSDILKKYFDRISENERTDLHLTISKSIKHLVKLLDDILLINKADADILPVQKTKVDSSSILKEVKAALSITYPGRTMICKGKEIFFLGDFDLLLQVFINLFENAAKYSSVETVIECNVSEDQEYIHFDIEDRGIGILEKDLQFLFKPFHRGANTGVQPGTGLGLYIVKRAIDLHDGMITIKNRSGGGTSIKVCLPLN